MQLAYTGPNPEAVIGALPLPEGWEAANHDEPDAAVAAAKVASGFYREPKPAKAATKEE